MDAAPNGIYCPCGGALTPFGVSDYVQRPVLCVQCDERWIAVYGDDERFIGLTREEWTNHEMRLIVPLASQVELRDELQIDQRRYRIVQIDMRPAGRKVTQQIVILPVYERTLGVEREPKTNINAPRSISGSFDMPLSDEVRAYYRHVFGDGDDRTQLIRAEVEAMDWPEIIDG